MEECCEKSDRCGDWGCGAMGPAGYLVLAWLALVAFVLLAAGLLRFLRVQRGEPHSKRALLIYFLLATLLLSRPSSRSPV